jgi:hypothetical protein
MAVAALNGQVFEKYLIFTKLIALRQPCALPSNFE